MELRCTMVDQFKTVQKVLNWFHVHLCVDLREMCGTVKVDIRDEVKMDDISNVVYIPEDGVAHVRVVPHEWWYPTGKAFPSVRVPIQMYVELKLAHEFAHILDFCTDTLPPADREEFALTIERHYAMTAWPNHTPLTVQLLPYEL